MVKMAVITIYEIIAIINKTENTKRAMLKNKSVRIMAIIIDIISLFLDISARFLNERRATRNRTNDKTTSGMKMIIPAIAVASNCNNVNPMTSHKIRIR